MSSKGVGPLNMKHHISYVQFLVVYFSNKMYLLLNGGEKRALESRLWLRSPGQLEVTDYSAITAFNFPLCSPKDF